MDLRAVVVDDEQLARDELGYLLSKEAELTAWEAAHPPRIDSLAEAS